MTDAGGNNGGCPADGTGRLSGGIDGNGQLQRRSRSLSLSREQVELADKQTVGGRAEPEVLQGPSTAQGEQSL